MSETKATAGLVPLRAVGLTLGYGRRSVLAEASIEVPVGVTVLLGENGAGKTTLLRALAGIHEPELGEILIDGAAADTDLLARSVGYLTQEISAVSWLDVPGYLDLAAYLAGVQRKRRRELVAEAMERVRLTGIRQRTSQLSGGTLRRLGIAATMVSKSPILLLDEPTAGLDPIQRAAIHRLILDLATDHAVLVSSYLTEDVAALATRVAVVAGGTVAFQGTTAELDALAGDGASSSDRLAAAFYALAGSHTPLLGQPNSPRADT